MKSLLISALLVCLSILSQSTSASDGIINLSKEKQTLVLLDNWAIVETHSVFFDSIEQSTN
jgi:hypothetical protein